MVPNRLALDSENLAQMACMMYIGSGNRLFFGISPIKYFMFIIVEIYDTNVPCAVFHFVARNMSWFLLIHGSVTFMVLTLLIIPAYLSLLTRF